MSMDTARMESLSRDSISTGFMASLLCFLDKVKVRFSTERVGVDGSSFSAKGSLPKKEGLVRELLFLVCPRKLLKKPDDAEEETDRLRRGLLGSVEACGRPRCAARGMYVGEFDADLDLGERVTMLGLP